MRVHDPRGAPGVLGIHAGGHEHGAVAEHARVEDRRDLPDDALVQQALRAREHLGFGHLRQLGHAQERARLEREPALEQVEEPAVQIVERDRGAVLPAPHLGYRSHSATSFAW
jgi:hypothetical protein